VWVSEANEGAHAVASELVGLSTKVSIVPAPAYLQPTHANDSVAEDTAMLLYLNKQTFANPCLAEEVRLVMAKGGKIVMAHENAAAKGGCSFDTFFTVTPHDLVHGGLFGPLAVALHSGDEHRAVSIRLLAVALGARVSLPSGCMDSSGECVRGLSKIGDGAAATMQMTVTSTWRRASSTVSKLSARVSRFSRRSRHSIGDNDDSIALEMRSQPASHAYPEVVEGFG